MPYTATLSIKKQTLPKKPKAVKDRGGGQGQVQPRSKIQWFFFKGFPYRILGRARHLIKNIIVLPNKYLANATFRRNLAFSMGGR